MSGVAAAVWCVTCGAAPDLVMTIERGGVLMHYGSCWSCVPRVAARAQYDIRRIDQRLRNGEQVQTRGEIVVSPEVEP